jgi:hypothetical protein
LKHSCSLSDEAVIERWAQDVYFLSAFSRILSLLALRQGAVSRFHKAPEQAPGYGLLPKMATN